MSQDEVKPLFIPLKSKWYDAFESGEKDTEYRPYGPRWNEKTCKMHRPVTLSKGYGKRHRLRGVIIGFGVSEKVCETQDWKDIYGDRKPAACIGIKLKEPS